MLNLKIKCSIFHKDQRYITRRIFSSIIMFFITINVINYPFIIMYIITLKTTIADLDFMCIVSIIMFFGFTHSLKQVLSTYDAKYHKLQNLLV